MIVSIVGGHGSIARLLTPLLSTRGCTVRGLVRDETQFGDLRDDGAEPVLCDLESASDDDIDDALDGSDVVVFAAGAGPDSGPERKKSLDRDGAIASVRSAVRVGADRFLIISSMGADDPPQDDENFSVYLRAKAEADDAVREATIDGTIIRPGALTDDEPTGRVRIGGSVGRGEIPRADVAAVLAAVIDTGRGRNVTFEVIGGETSVAEAVSTLE
ncbi:MAG: SDR family oxidoreductase [Acidimicrobiales bacterium]